MIILLRLLHVVLGMLWVGTAFFTTFFLTPAMMDVGPDGGKVMAAVQKRGFMAVMPIFAILTLVSGFWMYMRAGTEFMSTPVGRMFGIGGVLALLSFVLGISFVMPSMSRAAKLMQGMGAVPEQERAARMAEANRLRARGGAVGKVVSVLLLATAVAMAIARYM
jgi:uncharacterized membrane protein